MRRMAIAFSAAWLWGAGVVDRVAVTVGNQVITESEVVREARLGELMNGRPPDVGTEARRAAANRLVDQQLLRNEMEIVNYEKPKPQEVDAMLQQFRREHYPTPAAYQAALQRYGVTENELKQYLEWQLRVMRFTDQRFGAGVGLTAPGQQQSADRAANDASREEAVDQQLDAWLKQHRASTKIDFRQGAFEP
jgi:SurA N-terminal domain